MSRGQGGGTRASRTAAPSLDRRTRSAALLVGIAWASSVLSACGAGAPASPAQPDASAGGAAGAPADAAAERVSDLSAVDRVDGQGHTGDAWIDGDVNDDAGGDDVTSEAPPVADGGIDLGMARCFDGVQNGDESDVDCGGTLCSQCLPFWRCQRASDCLGMSCDPLTKHCRPSCTDGFLDGDETDVDCGGSCPKCRVHRDCSNTFDCATDMCAFWDHGNHCLPSRSCKDGVRDVGETDIDCGGPYCLPCAAGQTCAVNADCPTDCDASGICR